MDYLEGLNDVQRAAVECTDGPIMIVAGPGSGKTRVLTMRIAYLISELKVDSFRILALTFTNKAAAEMRERIQHIVGSEAKNLAMGTFHSVFARILRIEADKLGYPTNFTIYDTADSKSLIKNIIKEEGLNDKIYKPNMVYNRISSAKNNLISPKEYNSDSTLLAEDDSSGRPKLGRLYALYAKRCFRAGAMDFDDLLVKMHELLVKFPDVLYKYQHKFRYVLIDEYQDTNYAQYAITKKLGDVHQNITIVGDDAQSIYSFRGANIQNILNFEKDYPDLKIFKLEQNYRSTQNIVIAANEVIKKNRMQLPKEIWTENDRGDRIKVLKAGSESEEGRSVADMIMENQMRMHLRPKDFAILYRTNAQSRAFEESLRRQNIPYRVYGGISFYQRKEIKDMIAYLKLTVNHYDEEALRRIINYPVRGIGKASLERATLIANEQDRPMWDVLQEVHKYPELGRGRKTLEEFVVMIKSFTSMLKRKDAYELTMHIARSTGILKELYADKTIEGVQRYENVEELISGIKEYTEEKMEQTEGEINEASGLTAYLQEITLLTDMDTASVDADHVKMMSIHSAKGLEFPVVFVVGLEENLFPSMMSMNDREGLEEERRLFYVAITRAQKKLYLTYATSRFRFGTLNYCDMSRFIEDLPGDAIEMAGGLKRGTVRSASQARPDSFTHVARNLQNLKKLSKTGAAPVSHADFEASDVAGLQQGMEVEHLKFGSGKVINLEGDNQNRVATIDFGGHGQKRIMLKYAKLRICQQ